MLDEKAIAKIEEMAQPILHRVDENHADERQYVITKEGNIAQIRPELDYAQPCKLYSLDALVQMVKTEALKMHKSIIYIMASSYALVECFTQPDESLRFHRPILYSAKAVDIPGWESADIMPFEEALIAIRTRFQQSPDTEYLLRLLSEITNKAKVTFADNGVATSVLSQKGVALQSAEPIRPIVSLRPYRTFQEVEQPASEFHIRITERGIRFIEADGGMWKLTARKTIAEYLKENLSEAVTDGSVIVML